VIGGASGAWGDSRLAAPQLLDTRRCDYIVFEALAEVTMGLLTRAQKRDARFGFATDVVAMIGRDLGRFVAQGVRVVTNAGGVNPDAAAEKLRAMAAEAEIPIRVAVVTGDDLAPAADALRASGIAEMNTGAPLPDDVLSFNAYLGAGPIAAALDAGADIVITGRCVDSALVLGPLLHEFGWSRTDWDRLSQGSLAGHLLECGTQCTGGLLSDWEDVPTWEDLGYPIAECKADGSFVMTKGAGTGGLVDVRVVSEQLLYEIGDPARYLLPDVTCDWREVELCQVGPDRVSVRGARGRAAPAMLKACAQVLDGFKTTTLLLLAGRDAVARAERLGQEILRRVERILERRAFAELRAHEIEVLGSEATYGPYTRARGSREVVLRFAMHHDSAPALSAAVREIPSFALAVAGLMGASSGLPKPTPKIDLMSYLVPREGLRPNVELDGTRVPFEARQALETREPSPISHTPTHAAPSTADRAEFDDDMVEVPLRAIAHGRSGDKGPHANIGLRVRHRDFVPLVKRALTADAVAERFAHRGVTAVERFTLPGLDAFNFLLRDALGGGGIASLRVDAQGKAYAMQLLDAPIQVPQAWLVHPAFRAP